MTLAQVIQDAAAGSYPPVDGGWHQVPQWRPGLAAVVAFTGHAVFAFDRLDAARLTELGVDGYGGAHDPRVIADLAGPTGTIDCLDMLTAARGTGGGSGLVPRPDLAEHPRVRLARGIRRDVRVWGYPESTTVVTVASGIGGLTELSFELDPRLRGRGGSAAVLADALALVPAGELVIACVAPGNVASLRAVLRAGFVPLGSIQLLEIGG
jgi:hypothetical protein